jgi:hypothetical protein
MFILVILILVVFLSQFDASNNLISYKIRSSSSLFVVTSTQLIQLFANSDGESFYYLECHANGAIGIQSLLDTLGMPNSPLRTAKRPISISPVKPQESPPECSSVSRAISKSSGRKTIPLGFSVGLFSSLPKRQM